MNNACTRSVLVGGGIAGLIAADQHLLLQSLRACTGPPLARRASKRNSPPLECGDCFHVGRLGCARSHARAASTPASTTHAFVYPADRWAAREHSVARTRAPRPPQAIINGAHGTAPLSTRNKRVDRGRRAGMDTIRMGAVERK